MWVVCHANERDGFSMVQRMPCWQQKAMTAPLRWYNALAVVTRARSVPVRLGRLSGNRSDRRGGGAALAMSRARDDVPQGGPR